MTRLVEFVHSPYHNKHKEVRALTKYLAKVYPNFQEKNCRREVIFQSLYPRQKHDQSQLALLFTYLRRLVEHFLITERFKVEEARHKVHLLSELRERKQHRYYEKVMERFERDLEQEPLKDNKFYHNQFLKAAEADNFYLHQSKHKADHSIQLKQDYLDNYYLAQKLRDSCEMLVRSRILRVEYSTGLLESVLEKVEANLEYYHQIPPIMVYYYIYQMIKEGEAETFYEALRQVQQNFSFFKPEEQFNLYNYLQNYCVQQINKGQPQFLSESFRLFQDQLEKQLLFDERGYISEWHYKNIVTTGIRLREMDWTRDFIESYKERLHPEVLENAYTFNLASYYYSTHELEKVLDLLVRVEYKDIRYSLAAKSLLLRTYYDLEEYEALLSLSRSFTQYLHRNKLIPELRRRGLTNLVRFTHRASQIKTDYGFVAKEKSQREFQKLITDLRNTPAVINRAWLDEKVKELGEGMGK